MSLALAARDETALSPAAAGQIDELITPGQTRERLSWAFGSMVGGA
jgi:hypothetical protein